MFDFIEAFEGRPDICAICNGQGMKVSGFVNCNFKNIQLKEPDLKDMLTFDIEKK